MVRRPLVLFALVGALLVGATPAHAADGDLNHEYTITDATGPALMRRGTDLMGSSFIVPTRCGTDCSRLVSYFADSGVSGTGADTVPFTVGRLADGGGSRVLALGYQSVARFRYDGTLDPGFAGGGVVQVPGLAVSAAVAPDNSIYIGSEVQGTLGSCASDAVVTHLHGDGTVDTAFGTNGSVTIDAGPSDTPSAIVADANGVDVAVATRRNAAYERCVVFTSDEGGAIVRYDGHGSPDTTFGFHGVVPLSTVSTQRGNGHGVGLAAARGLVFAAHGRELRGVRSDGSTAASYALGPMLATSVEVDGSGRFVVGGDHVQRLLPDGSPDESFGTCGIARFPGTADINTDTSRGDIVVTSGLTVRLLGSAESPFQSRAGAWLAGSDGGVFTTGDALFCGSAGNLRLNQPIVGMAGAANGNGYWLVARDGGIFSYGHAAFFGSTGNLRLNQPIVGMSAYPVGYGYWLVARDGGIFSFAAPFYGSTGAIRLNQPIVGMAPTPTGGGYWLVASDGGVFSFGDARFFGSTGAIRLNQPIVAMAPTPTGGGYFLVAADGGVFTFGDAVFNGSAVGRVGHAVGITAAGNDAYRVFGADGTVVNLGPEAVVDSLPIRPASPVVAIAGT